MPYYPIVIQAVTVSNFVYEGVLMSYHRIPTSFFLLRVLILAYSASFLLYCLVIVLLKLDGRLFLRRLSSGRNMYRRLILVSKLIALGVEGQSVTWLAGKCKFINENRSM